jgi:hypothetical protein
MTWENSAVANAIIWLFGKSTITNDTGYPVMDRKQMKIQFGAVLAIMGFVGGCATGGGSHDSGSTSTPAAAAVTTLPLPIPAASTKRLVLNMSGPTTVTQAKDWPAFQEEWRATFTDHAKAAGVAFELQKGDPHSIGTSGTLLQVYVNDYRMVGIGARIFLGVMTGNAYIDAKGNFSDLDNGNVFGERIYNTASSAWGGVFAKMTPQQVDAIATMVFSELGATK